MNIRPVELSDDMDIEEAVTEFVNMLRIGSASFREIVAKNAPANSNLEEELNQLLYLVESLEDLGEQIRDKTRAARRQTPY